jgi:hypothetical protein
MGKVTGGSLAMNFGGASARLGRSFKIVGLLLLASLMYGCATDETPIATGGNKAGGTVDLAFEFGLFQAPKVDWDAAGQTAKQRCAAWGYKDAQAFGGANNQCLAVNGYGSCLRTRVTMTYQCTGGS